MFYDTSDENILERIVKFPFRAVTSIFYYIFAAIITIVGGGILIAVIAWFWGIFSHI